MKRYCTLFFLTLIFMSSLLVASGSDPSTDITQSLDLRKVFQGAPVIYSSLLIMSVASISIWLYSMMVWKEQVFLPEHFLVAVRNQIAKEEFEQALKSCEENESYISSIIASGIATRHQGPHVVMEAMSAEGRRLSTSLWQRISLLNDIAVTAPMLGLLGTVLGMFYAFYDPNRSIEGIAALFDGLGIAIGTTVAGLIVAIIAMIFHTTLKLRITALMSSLEAESLDVGALFKTSSSQSPAVSADFSGSV